MDLGESIVGAYFRHVRKCHTVAFNQFLPHQQGEIDVIGLAELGGRQEVWMAEVAVHIKGLNYGDPAATAAKIGKKVAAARAHALEVYRDDDPVVEFWSPNVPPGMASLLSAVDVRLVINEEFTDRVNVLAAIAAKTAKTYGDPAFRFLQILTHLRGPDRPTFTPPRT